MDTWLTWSHCAPAEAIIVVSEIGEQWSPHTAPAIQAEIEIIISSGLVSWNTATTIGIKIPNVPHEVPVAKAKRHPTTKIIAGKKITNPDAALPITPATYSAAPRLSVILFKVHANVRIKIAGTIALKPSAKQAIQSLNEITLLITYNTIVIITPKKLPKASPTDASLFEKAVTKFSPLKNPPV